MWLRSLSWQGASLRMRGVALDNQAIARFMSNLKASPFITAVNLSASSLNNIEGNDLTMFSLSCGAGLPTSKKQANAPL